MSSTSRIGLVGDLGGTNARFALACLSAEGEISLQQPASLPAADFTTPEAIAAHYVASAGGPKLDFAALACAGPVQNGRVSFTNLAWAIDQVAFARPLGLASASLVNDLEAVAWALPCLQASDCHDIGSVSAGLDAAPCAVMGVGTGMNASVYWPNEQGHGHVLVGEAGHAGFAPACNLDLEIWRYLAAQFGRVSIERLISGPGLKNLYDAICDIEAAAPVCLEPSDLAALAEAGNSQARKALEHFTFLMGSVAGDLALTFGARGGVYVAGGIAPNLLSELDRGRFREGFEAKGRFQSYLAAIPTRVILHPHAALLGVARARGGLT